MAHRDALLCSSVLLVLEAKRTRPPGGISITRSRPSNSPVEQPKSHKAAFVAAYREKSVTAAGKKVSHVRFGAPRAGDQPQDRESTPPRNSADALRPRDEVIE